MATQSSSHELTTNDLPVLCNALNDVAPKCFELGLQLGLRKANIDIIIKNNKDDCQAQLREIISERLKEDSPLTWHDILTALRSPSVNFPDLVRHIESWYKSPSLDLQQHPSSDPQQHLSLGGERPYPMLIIGQSTPNRDMPNRDMPNRDIPTCSLCDTCFRTIIKPVFSCLCFQRGPSNGGNYQPPTQTIGQMSLTGALHTENYQMPTQMMSQTPWRGAPHGENSQFPARMMSQAPVRGPSHRENYQLPTIIMGQGPIKEASHSENSQPIALLREPADNRLPDSVSLGNRYMCLRHHMTPYQTGYPNTLSTTQPYPSIQTQGNSATAHHRSPMDLFVHYVKSTYKKSEIEKNLNVLKWPPTPSKIFINLACIDWESVVSKEEADEYTRAMVEDGNVDVIMKEKRNIDFDDIVRDLPPLTAEEKVVLIEGAPGVGKFTFAWEFCRRWERGEVAHQYQLVLLLRLRDERISRAKSLNDLIYHSSGSVCQAVVEELEFTSGVNTLIILEGFDELPDSQRKESSIFLQLILGQLLLHATIMITSRPWATGASLVEFKHRIFLHVEILGFTEDKITKYVTSVFTGEGKKTASSIDQSREGSDEVNEEARIIDDVMAYIGKYPQIKACMYIPLNAAIVVSMYRESMKSKWVLPTTLTELYHALTRILLLRYLRGHAKHQKCNVESFENLPGDVYNQLLVISKIAYDGVCTDGKKSVQLIYSDIPDDFETLGLMQSVSQLFVDGQKTSHNFLHLTFQEFLAAFLISTMSSAEQLKHFQRHKDGRLRVVLRFLAGLTKLNKVTPDQLRRFFGKPTVEQRNEYQIPYCNPMRPDVCVSAYHTNWLFEAQNSELLQSLFQSHTASFTFTRGMLPLEFYSVGYCIIYSHSKWSLTFCGDTEEEKLHMLVKGAKTGDSEYRVAVKTTSMIPEKMHILVNGFSCNMEEIYYLKIPDNDNSLYVPPISTLHILELQIDNNKSAFNISCDLSFSSLETLIISSCCSAGTSLGANTCEAIGKLLSSTTSLKKFYLSLNIRNYTFNVHVSSKNMEVITKGLSVNIAQPLETLDIDCKCTFTTTATKSLAQFITRSTTLQYLKIHIDTFNDVDIFAKGLSDNIALPLKSLDIDCKCTFTTTGTRSLVEFITRSTTLQHMSISHVTFSAQGLIELTEAIHHCSRLQEKQLGELSFRVECSDDVVNLRDMIKDHPDMLKSITEWDGVTNVHSSSIQLDEERKASILRLGLGCSQDIYLSLVGISISDAGVEALAQALHHSTTLEKLDIDCKCTFITTATRFLVEFITRSTTLQYIRICHVTFSAQGLIELTEALHHCSRLQEKKLEELTFRVECSEDVVNLRDMIKDHPDMLKSITNWDGVTNVRSSSIHLDKEGKASIMSLGLGCCQDTFVSLNGMSISDAGAVALAHAFQHNSTLMQVDLSNNSVSDAGAIALAQALYHNSTLESLNLSHSRISDAGAVALAQTLRHNSTLKKLHLSKCISDIGAITLAQALRHNCTLESLNLSHNSICNAGAVALAQAIHHNSTLKELHLSNQGISDAGAVALAEALHHNSTLEWLDLSGNDGIGKEGTHHLVQALTVNTSITYCGLILPMMCKKYAIQCTQYNTVKDRIQYW